MGRRNRLSRRFDARAPWRGIIKVAEGDFPSLCNSGLDAVYADVDALVDSFYAAVDVQMPFQQRGVSGSNKGRQPLDQLLAFPGVMNRADCTASMSSLTSGASKCRVATW